MSKLSDHLEPAAQTTSTTDFDAERNLAIFSIAISLKRIADSMATSQPPAKMLVEDK